MNRNANATKILLLMNQNILDMNKNTQHIDENSIHCINTKVSQTTLDNQLHHEILVKLLLILVLLVVNLFSRSRIVMLMD